MTDLMRPRAEPLIELDDVSVARGRKVVVPGLDLSLGEGVCAIAGRNGTGKSSLLRVVATLLPARSGRVRVCGHDVADRSGRAEARRLLGYLGQSPSFPGSFRVEEAVRYAAWVHRVADPARATAEVLAALALEDVATQQLRRLSGGTRQRALLAQAIVHRPKVLLLDEPTVGIDVEHRVQLREQLRSVAVGRLVVVTTHITEDIELLADRVVVLQDGRSVFDGSPEDLAASGAADATDRLRPVEAALRRLGGFEPRPDPVW